MHVLAFWQIASINEHEGPTCATKRRMRHKTGRGYVYSAAVNQHRLGRLGSAVTREVNISVSCYGVVKPELIDSRTVSPPCFLSHARFYRTRRHSKCVFVLIGTTTGRGGTCNAFVRSNSTISHHLSAENLGAVPVRLKDIRLVLQHVAVGWQLQSGHHRHVRPIAHIFRVSRYASTISVYNQHQGQLSLSFLQGS